MSTIFVLLVLFLVDGEPKVITDTFDTKAACEASIQYATAALLEEDITESSVTCIEKTLGEIT